MMLGTRLRSAGSEFARPAYANATREEIAKHMLEVAGRGERDRHILAEDAVEIILSRIPSPRAGLCEGLAWPQPLVRGFGLHGRSGPGQSLALRVRRGSVSHFQHFVQIARRVGFAGRYD